MKSFSLYNSKIFKFFDYIFRIVLINLLIFVPSFLLFYLMTICFKSVMDTPWGLLTLIPTVLYIYPAICAGVDLVRKYELKLCNTIFKEFFKSLKKVYIKALIETIGLIVIFLLFYNSISFFYLNLEKGIIYIVGLLLSAAFLIMLLVVIIHLPLVMNYMRGCRVIDDVKLASMMAFKDLAISIALVITIIFIAGISIFNDTVAIICGFSLPIVLLVKLTFKKYYIVYIRTHKEENE